MLTFILPGYSPRNKDWAQGLAKEIKVEGEVRPVSWEHWEDPEKTFKPKAKAQDIVDVMLKDNANIIAKSVGTLVAAYVCIEKPRNDHHYPYPEDFEEFLRDG